MLRRIIRTLKFWNERTNRFPFCVEHVKIATMRPEDYTKCKHISIPTGNVERIWGFKTQDEAQEFVEVYRNLILEKYYGKDQNTITERYIYVEESNKWLPNWIR